VLLSEKEIDGYEMNDQKHDGVDDCAQMPYLSEASVLHNLKIRYDCDCIYVCFSF
jgi:myosin heavy subunit